MELRRIAIYSALTRVETVMGCDRSLFLASLTVAVVLIVPAGLLARRFENALLGAVVMLVAYRVLVWLGKYDDRAREVWGRARLYSGEYLAVEHATTPAPEAKSWR